jgi:Spy/CpxP family protein refolding chaperone
MMDMSGSGMAGMHDTHKGMGTDKMDIKRLARALSSLDLTSEQTVSLKRLRIQHQRDAIPLRAKVMHADVEIEELELADKPDLKRIETIVNEKHDALAKLDISHIDLFHKMKALLTPTQRQQLQSVLEHGPTDHGREHGGDHDSDGRAGEHRGH